MNEIKHAKKERDLVLNLPKIIDNVRNLKDAFPTIQAVKLSPDLSHAKVFMTFLSSEEKNLERLNSAAGYIRSELSQILNWRKVPKLKFLADEVTKKAERIDAILDSLKKE